MKKKLSLVLFILFFLNSCSTTYVSKATQKNLIDRSTIKLGMPYRELVDILGYDIYGWWYPAENTSKKYLALSSSNPKDYSYLFLPENDEKIGLWNFNQYKLEKIFDTRIELINHILTLSNIHPKDEVELSKRLSYQKRRLKEAEERIADNKTDSEKEIIEMTEMINKAKNTCRSLGFEEGTDKFTDCSLKLYTQDVDNKVALKVSKQKSSNSSSSGSMIIYDPVRDRQNQIDKGMKMLSGGCTLGIDC